MDYNDGFISDERQTATSFDLFFTILAFLTAGFSGYTTFKGFYFDFSFFPAFLIALIIGLGLLIINFKIRDARRDNESLFGPLIAFFLLLMFSFISNTNAFYTFFLEREASKKTQIEAWRVFDKGTISILDTLNQNIKNSDISVKKEALDKEFYNFEQQILDPRNLGVGPKAKRHLRNIEDILGVTLTSLKRPSKGSPPDRYREYISDIRDLIDEQYKVSTYKSSVAEIERLKSDINEARNNHKEHLDIKNGHETFEDKMKNSSETDKMARELSSFKERAITLVGFNKVIDDVVKITDDIGSFQHTWRNFLNFTNEAAIVLSIFLSLLLDILTPLFSILLYKREVNL